MECTLTVFRIGNGGLLWNVPRTGSREREKLSKHCVTRQRKIVALRQDRFGKIQICLGICESLVKRFNESSYLLDTENSSSWCAVG